MNDHSSLHRAKVNKEDEFYTLYEYVDNSLRLWDLERGEMVRI